MKKTLVALAVTAFTASASATTIYNQDGSNVDFYGSLRLVLDNGNSKTGDVKTEKHSNLHNAGSRFGLKLKHDISEDFYALGRVEFRFDGEKSTTDEFGDLYAKRAYVGFGSKEFGELTFGRQVLIGDDIAQAGYDYSFGILDETVATDSNSAIRYDYKGIEGLDLSLDYRFAEKRDANTHDVVVDELKSGYSVGGVYSFDVAAGQSATVAAGYSRDNYATEAGYKSHKDGYQAGVSYTIDSLTLAADYAGSFATGVKIKDQAGVYKKRSNGFRVGPEYHITPALSVYGAYARNVEKYKSSGETAKKIVNNNFMLGSGYQIHKNVLTYIEGRIKKEKTTEAAGTSKKTDKVIGIGMRVSW